MAETSRRPAQGCAVVHERDARGRRIVRKTISRTAGDPAAIESLRHEHIVLCALGDVPGVVHEIAFSERGGLPELVLDDEVGSRSVADLPKPVSIEAFLDLALELSGILGAVHDRAILHGRLEPAAIVLDPAGRPTLVGFESATVEPMHPAQRGSIDANLSYASPELLGSIARPVDHRADLYSFGAILFELLTGSPPFRSSDPLELVHAHLARRPVDPSIIHSGVPAGLSSIVLALLEKLPERRYQSARAVAADLREAQRQWRESRKIAPFPLGLDRAPLPPPERLFGRDKEIAQLRAALERVGRGRSELVLIAGAPGAGKTALVGSLRDEVLRRGGWLLEGKFDPKARNVPYAPIVDVLRGLVARIRLLPEERRASLAKAIRTAVGPSGRVLLELLPELRDTLGDLPPLATLDPLEARARIQRVFEGLLRALAAEVGPVVLFLDDLQWVDGGSIELLRSLAVSHEIRRVLLLGALRPCEVAPDHALARLMGDLEREKAACTRIELEALPPDAIRDLLAAALHRDRDEVRDLGEALRAKAGGNPFFVREVLRALWRDRHLVLDEASRRWTWDAAAIERVSATANVVELLVHSISKLPASCRELMAIAACQGSVAELRVLAAVVDRPEADVAVLLGPALERDLLIGGAEPSTGASGVAYRFSHDRVQQAVYDSIPEAERAPLHRRIGERARVLEGEAPSDARIFFVATQLNLGASALATEAERVELATLDHRAALLAQKSAAFGPALSYLLAGIDVLPGWRGHHELAVALHREAAALALVEGDHAASERLALAALAHEPSRVESVEILDIRVVGATVRGRWAEALALGREALHHLGRELEERDVGAALAVEKRAIEELLADKPIRRLLDAPDMTAPEDLAHMKLLVDLVIPSWFVDHARFQLVIQRALRLALERGNPPGTISPFSGYAAFLAGEDRFERAAAFGELAIEDARRRHDLALETQALTVCSHFVFVWSQPLSAVLATLRRAFELGIESGAVRYAAFALAALLRVSFVAGVQLDDLLREVEEGMPFLERTRNESMILNRVIHRQAIRCLQGHTGDSSFDDETFREADFLEAVKGDPVFRTGYAINREKVAYIFGDLVEARRQCELASEGVGAIGAHDLTIEYGFYTPLVFLALCDGAPPEERAALVARTVAPRRRLALWAASCAANFLHRKQLVEAEVARVEARDADAVDLYECAIEGAAQEGFVQDLAVANERAARHAFARGRREAGTLRIREALRAYERWGARGKVRALETEFLGVRSHAEPVFALSNASIDLLGVLKAAEVITAETSIERLLEALVRVCLEIGGADGAVLVLEEDGAPTVRALGGGGTLAPLPAVPLRESSEVPRSVIERVRSTRQPFVSNDAEADPRASSDPYVIRRKPRSLMGVPVLRQARLVATLYLENRVTTHAFSAGRVRVLELLSGHLATSLENRRLIERLEQEVADRGRAEANVRFLANASERLAGSLDTDTTLRHVAQLAVPALASICVLDLLDPAGGLRRVTTECEDPTAALVLPRLLERLPPGTSSTLPPGSVVATAEPLLVPDLAAVSAGAPGRDDLAAVRSLGVTSLLSVPVTAHGATLGVLTLVSLRSDRRYGPESVAVARELARRIGVAVENARLYGEAREAIRVRDEFLSIAAHELYTPITSLSLTLRGLLTGRLDSSPPSLGRALSLAERQVRRLTGLIDGLLNVSRIQGGKLTLERERVDLGELVSEVTARFAVDVQHAGSTLAVSARPRVIGSWDRGRLDQVVTNLLLNAIKFGRGEPIDIAVDVAGDRALLAVRDHGIGIAAADLTRIFAPFERAVSTRQYGGLGLGLFIVRSIVEAHGGTVRARSVVGEGTTIEVELPLEPGGAGP